MEAYRYVIINPLISPEIKDEAKLAFPYRSHCAVSYLTEQIIGRKDYVYGQVIGGEDHIRNKFDTMTYVGAYESIFGHGSKK